MAVHLKVRCSTREVLYRARPKCECFVLWSAKIANLFVHDSTATMSVVVVVFPATLKIVWQNCNRLFRGKAERKGEYT